MQLAAMDPGADVVLVNDVDFCRTDRFGRIRFPLPLPRTGRPCDHDHTVQHVRGRAVHHIMADSMNDGYREPMDFRQLGLYAHEHSLAVHRIDRVKAPDGIIRALR